MKPIYLNGEWTESQATEAIEVVNPTTEEVLDRVPAGTPADVDRAVSAAVEAFPAWSRTSAPDRAAALSAIADAVVKQQQDIAEVITADVGSTTKFAMNVQTGLPIQVLRSYAELLATYSFEEELGNSMVLRQPVGVVAAITPWNYPLHQIVAKLAAALAAGCTVVIKPSEIAPLAAYRLMEIVDAVGLPPGVVNLVVGTGAEVGEALVRHESVDMVSFTGSTRAGRRITEIAGLKRLALELGGKSANLILPDADLALAVKVGLANGFINAGQTCNAQTRILVPADRHDEIVELIAAGAARYPVGDPTDPQTRVGPVASATQRDRVRGYIDAAEGRLVVGGAEPPAGLDRGYFVQPTVFADVPSTARIAQEEIFGPVLAVTPYADEDDAVRIANGTPYGLGGAVWGSPERALAVARRLRTGQVDVNGGRFNPLAPFGGYKESGRGRELGRFGLEEFTEVTSLQR